MRLPIALVAGALASWHPLPAPPFLARYDLAAAPTWSRKLPKKLTEISGLAFTADGRLFAHGDEEGTVWQLDGSSGEVVKQFALAPVDRQPDFGKPPRRGRVTGDFEDIAIVGDRFFLLASNGMLAEFHEGGNGASVPFTAYDTGLRSAGEFEGLAYDPGTRSLLLLCKHPRDAWRDQVVVFAWNVDTHATERSPRIRVPFDRITRGTGAKAFHGSALLRTPDGTLVMIAGPQKLFAEVSPAGDVLANGRLDASAHRQPEGLALAPDGTLLVSDEGAGKHPTLAGYRPRAR